MIRVINISLNAAHPELPLCEATTFALAPSAVFIHGVPRRIGSWEITAVRVAATYPDGVVETRRAVESPGGVWTATIPGGAVAGRTDAGLRIYADGVDENGAAVTGYVLGFADLSVRTLSAAPVPEPGASSFEMWFFEERPENPKAGYVYAETDGTLMLYNGSAWVDFGGGGTSDYGDLDNKPSINNVTLSGNKTAAELGLATAAQGVKANSAYQKPQAGIPASDMTQAVQASLGKANTALQTAGGTTTGELTFNRNATLSFDIPMGSVKIFGSAYHSLVFRAIIDDKIVNEVRLDDIAPLASPAFTGTPTAPTPTAADNSTKVATTAFVQTAISEATPNLDYVMRVDPETGGIYYTTPDTNA